MLRRGTLTLREPAVNALFNRTNYAALKARQASRLVNLTATSTELGKTKDSLDARAAAYPDRHAWGIFGYLVAQNAVLFHWTYQRFDWNLVEPITYLLGYAVVWLCTTVYFACGKEFTYDALREHLVAKRRATLYADHDFDVAAFESVQEQRERLARIVAKDRL